MPVTFAAWSPPPSPKPKMSPWNALPPDLVSTFTAPPVSRPYSAFRPPVFTSTSCTKSKFSVLPSVPVFTPVVFRPSMMYWFSALVDPLIDGP